MSDACSAFQNDTLENETVQEVSETDQEVSGALENEIVKEEDLVKNPVKKKRVMSEAQKECLKLAREKAVLYRFQLREEKEKMGVKTEKKLNKTQLKLLKLKEKIEPSEVVNKPIIEKTIDACSAFPNDACSAFPNDACSAFPNDACSAFPNGNDKPIIKPSIFRNENGFYCI